MKKKLVDLIAKLKEAHPYYDISTKNFMAPDVVERLVKDEEGNMHEVRDQTHTVVMRVTVFGFIEGATSARIERTADGIGEGGTRAEAVENATIEAIYMLGIN